MPRVILMAIFLGSIGCAKSPTFDLEEEGAIVLEFLKSGTGVRTPGFIIAVELRSPELERLVFSQAEVLGMNVAAPSQFRVTTGHLIRVEEPQWGKNTITLRTELVGASSSWSTAHFSNSGSGYELQVSYSEGNISEWEPADFGIADE